LNIYEVKKRDETKQNEKVLTVFFSETKRKETIPGKPSSDTHDQIRNITLKTTTAKTKKVWYMSSEENDDRLCNMHCDT
jgi:hypothetical protein